MKPLQRYVIGDCPKQGMRIVDILHGGMGIVYVLEVDAMDGTAGGSGVKLALKTCPTQSAMSPEGMAFFQREALTWLSLLPHPNVVKAMTFEIDAGLPTILMEYVPGGNLRDRLGSGALPLGECLRIASEICEAMVFLGRTAGVVHRDIKPENLLFGEDASVKVTDFGISAPLAAAGEEGGGGAVGTLPYMAPEQLEGRQDIDARADVYAFGVVLHEMLTGHRPFKAATSSAMREAQRRPLSDPLLGEIPAPVRSIVERCLRNRPDDRFASFVEIGDALATACAALGWDDCVPRRVVAEQLEAELDSIDWNNRGYAFRQLGDLDEALRCYRRSIEASRQGEKADTILVVPGVDKRRSGAAMGLAASYNNMGMLLLRLGRGAEAANAFAEALKLVPDEGHAYYGLGQIALAEDRPEDAAALYLKAIECEPGNTDFVLKYVRLCAALGKRAEFEEGLATVIARKRDDAPYLVALACLLGEGLGPGVTAEIFDAAIDADPGNASAWYNRGVAVHRRGEAGEALGAYEKALQFDPHHPYARFYAGIAALQLRRKMLAASHLQKLAGRGDLGPFGEIAEFAVRGLAMGVPADVITAGFADPGTIKYVP